MKILFWTDGFWPRIGGIETQALQFVKALGQRGHQCLVVTQQDKPTWPEDEVCEGIKIKRFDYNRMILERQPKSFRLVQDYIEWILQEFRPDVIHLNASIGGSVFVFLLFNLKFQIPIVQTIHAPYDKDLKNSLLVQQILSSIDVAGCVSQWVLDEMKHHHPQFKDKFRLIYNGLSMPEIAPEPLVFSPPIILLLGRLSLEKGFQTAIEAFGLLKKRGTNGQLLIVGEGWERSFLENLVEQLGLLDSVHFQGPIPITQVFSTINRSTLVVVPSHSESFGLTALEAMQMQRPVIASRVGGLSEIICDGKTGILVPSRDPIALCNAMQTLLEDPQTAITMGLEGRKWAMDKFTLTQHVTQYENLYHELTGALL